jgi:hypothetical protein
MSDEAYNRHAYRNDDDPEVVFVTELFDDKSRCIVALRVDGAWEDFDKMTFGDLLDRYREVEDPAEVDQLIAEARASLGRKGYVIVGARPGRPT